MNKQSKLDGQQIKENIDINIFKSLFENSLSGILYGNPDDGNVYDSNQSAANMFGYTISELNKLNRNDIFDFNHPSMINSLRYRSENGSAKGELIGIRKNGERFPCEFASSIFENENGEKRTCTILNDISERRKSEEEMQLLLDNTEESFVLIDKELKILSFNRLFAIQYKNLLKKEVIKGDSMIDYSLPERRNSIVNIYKTVLEGHTIKDKAEFRNSNGDLNYFSVTYKPARNCDGDVIGIFLTAKDVTEKTIAVNQSLIERRDKEALINLTHDLIWSVSKDFKLIAANEAFYQTMKIVLQREVKPGENLLFTEKVDLDFVNVWKQIYLRGFSGESFKFETITPSQYTNVVYLETTIKPIYEKDEVIGIACYSRDITEIKNANLKLQQSSDILNKLTEKLPTAIFQFEISSTGKMFFPYISKGIEKINPLLLVDILKQDAASAFSSVHRDDLPMLMESIDVSMVNLEDWELEFRTIKETGEVVWLHGKASPEKKEDNSTIWYGYFTDITEKKKDIEKIEFANHRYDLIAQATNDVIWDCDLVKKEIYWVKGVFGYSDAPSQTNLCWWFSKIHPEDLERVVQKLTYVYENNETRWEDEFRFLTDDGTYKYVHDRGFLVTYDSIPLRMIGAMQDITSRKIAEKEKEHVLSVLNRTSEIAKIGGWEVDLVTNEHFWSDEIYKIFEVEEYFRPNIDSVIGFFAPHHKYLIQNAIYDGINEGLNWSLEIQAYTTKGKLIWVCAQGVPVVKNNKTVKLLGTLQDITERKIDEENLKAANERYAIIAKATNDTIWDIDCINHTIFWNKGIKGIYGYCDNEPNINNPDWWFTKIHPDDLERVKQENEKWMKSKASRCEFEYRFLCADNTYKYVYDRGFLVLNDKDEIVRMIGAMQDITERKLAEAKYFESELRFKKIFDADPECVKIVDSTGKLIIMNKAGMKMLGANSIEEVNNYGLFNIVLPKYRTLYSVLFNDVMSGNEANIEYEAVGFTGSKLWMETTAVPIKNINGTIEMMLSVTRDITKRKKEEHRLKLLESVITNTNDSVMITEAEPFDEPGPRIVYVNEAFTRMTGYTEGEVLGKSPRFLQGPKTDKNELSRLSEDMRNWKSCETTVVNYKKNGEEYWVNFSIKPIADDTGWYTHWIAVERDVTEQKKYEQEREQMVSELSQNIKDLKHFSYVTSHNLRAPIANLLGLTSLIDQFKVNNKSLKQILDGIKQSALIFDDTVKDLTKVLVIKDQTNIVKEEVLFNNVIESVLKQISISLNDHDIKIDYSFQDAPKVEFTNTYLESILLNLFTNSIKYKSHKRNLKISILSKRIDNYIELRFSDNGIGIDTEKYKDKLFKLYQRFHDNPDGKGLGLYLIKSQIEALGGTIEIDSKVDVGTTFIVKFKNN